MSNGLRESKAWQEAVVLAGEVVRAVRQSNRPELKGFLDSVMLAGATVASRIADGQGRYGASEQQLAYREARRALADLETRLAVARQAGLLSASTLVRLSAQVALVGRSLAGSLSYLERQIALEGHADLPARASASDVQPVAVTRA
jgi:four helix bundle protein